MIDKLHAAYHLVLCFAGLAFMIGVYCGVQWIMGQTIWQYFDWRL